MFFYPEDIVIILFLCTGHALILKNVFLLFI